MNKFLKYNNGQLVYVADILNFYIIYSSYKCYHVIMDRKINKLIFVEKIKINYQISKLPFKIKLIKSDNYFVFIKLNENNLKSLRFTFFDPLIDIPITYTRFKIFLEFINDKQVYHEKENKQLVNVN